MNRITGTTSTHIPRWILPLLAFIFMAAMSFAAAMKCDLCNRQIKGSYYGFKAATGQTVNVCPQCNSSKPRCQLCNLPSNISVVPGQPAICPGCARQVPKCSACGTFMVTGYQGYKIAGHDYRVCSTCERTQPRCFACNVPFNSKYLKVFPNGRMWCSGCLKDSVICTGCESPITGKFYKIEYVEGTWCAGCYESRSKCHTCQAPIIGEKTKTADGREMCPTCASMMISGTERYQNIALQLKPSMTALLGRDFQAVPVRAVPLAELRTYFAEGGIKTSGHTNPNGFVEEMGLFRQKGKIREIVVLDSLPQDMVWETIAHEMAHAWQEQHYPQCTELVLTEGFAQWVAEHLCVKHQRKTTVQRLRSRPDVYGRGYRLMTSLETVGGKDLIFKALKDNKLPE